MSENIVNVPMKVTDLIKIQDLMRCVYQQKIKALDSKYPDKYSMMSLFDMVQFIESTSLIIENQSQKSQDFEQRISSISKGFHSPEQEKICKRSIYVLLLEDGRYYIGQSQSDPQKRIKDHFNGKGSSWTKKYRPIAIKDIFEIEGDYRDGEFVENDTTYAYMKEYGIENVRGGFFCNVNIEVVRKGLKAHQYNLESVENTL